MHGTDCLELLLYTLGTLIHSLTARAYSMYACVCVCAGGAVPARVRRLLPLLSEQLHPVSGLHAPVVTHHSLTHSFTHSLTVCLSRMYYAGHLQEAGVNTRTVTFAGISLANMYANVTGFAFLVGMSSAVDTAASQLNGAQRYEVN